MKKLITLFTFTLSLASLAAPSWSTLYTGAYSGDKEPSSPNSQYYSAYYCTVAAAQSMFKADTVAGISTYPKNNLAAGKTAMGKTEGSFALTQSDYGAGQYQFISYFADQIAEGNYFAVAFYNSEAFEVFSSSDVDSGNLTFDDKSASTTAGGWMTGKTEDVPEPTSGLLLLLGLGALALKRKA